jgi:hypothetical protein
VVRARLIAVLSFALAAWATVDAVRSRLSREQADTSLVGIGTAAVSSW